MGKEHEALGHRTTRPRTAPSRSASHRSTRNSHKSRQNPGKRAGAGGGISRSSAGQARPRVAS
jgi:hypothetical protein